MLLPLTVHVLYHKDFSEGQEMYSRLYKLLCRDYRHPFDTGLDIPVYFHTDDERGAINDVNTTISKRTYILLIIDQNMYLSECWKTYINDKLTVFKDNDNVKVYAVGLYKYAFELSSRLSKNQFFNINSESIISVWDEFQIRLYDTLIRFLTDFNEKDKGHPIKQQSIFISHAKIDGKRMAEDLRDYLVQSGSKLSSFFDVNSIMEGYNFEDQLLDNVRESLMIVIFTNAYSSREWCVKEIMSAKKTKRPLIVVYAVDDVVERSFPYIGNVPTIVYKGNWLPVVNLLLKTTLNQFHQELLLSSLKEEKVEILSVTPDAYSLSYIAEKPNTEHITVVYPEPPIGKDEMSLLLTVRGGGKTNFCTPIQYRSFGVNLKKRNVAISISDTDDQLYRGIGQEMLKDVTIEIIRHIFISNGKIVYGGNISENGYTELFRELSLQYGQYCNTVNKEDKGGNQEDARYVTSFIAWPYYTQITRDQLCEFQHSRVDLCFSSPGHDATEDEKRNGLRPCSKTDERKVIAAALTRMRNDIESFKAPDEDGEQKGLLARIFIGGKTKGYLGKEPGLVEEFKLSLHNRPIVLIGGFGGVSRSILLHILGEEKLPYLDDISIKDLMCGDLSDADIEVLKNSTNIFEIVPVVLHILSTCKP